MGVCGFLITTMSQNSPKEEHKVIEANCENNGSKVMIKLHSEAEETMSMNIPDPEKSTDYKGDYEAMMKQMELNCGIGSDDSDEEQDIELGYNKGRGVPMIKSAPKKKKKKKGCCCIIS